MAPIGYVSDIAIVLGVAAATNLLFRRLKQPNTLGYLLAGLIVGPYLPVPLFADPERIHALSELGVVLVMFVIGLEFQIGKLRRILPLTGFAAIVQMACLLWAGSSFASALDWTQVEAMFLGASIAISSTMVVSKVFDEANPEKDVRAIVLGVLVLQDVAAVGLIAGMSAVAESGMVSTGALTGALLSVTLVLIVMVVVGLLVVPRLIRYVARLKHPETLVITSIGICFVCAASVEAMGYSVALGAFVAGILAGESGRSFDINYVIQPVRDLFAAIFFVSIGMTVNPVLAIQHLPVALLLCGLIIGTQFLSLSVGGIVSGLGLRRSLTAGLALGQIGEFAFIIAGIGIAAGVVRVELQSILVTVAVITTFTTSFSLSKSSKVIQWVDRHLPKRFQTNLVFYEAWFERIRRPREKGTSSESFRALRSIVVDALLGQAIIVVGLVWRTDLTVKIGSLFDLPSSEAQSLLFGLIAVLSLPFFIGVGRNQVILVRALPSELTTQRAGVPNQKISPTGQAFLRGAIQLMVVMGVGIPLAAILKALAGLPVVGSLVTLAIFLALIQWWFVAGRWRTEIRSETERFVDYLADQLAEQSVHVTPAAFFPDIEKMDGILIEDDGAAVGKTLAELNLRVHTGALVIAIHRDEKDVVMPTGSDVVRAGDLLMITGSATSLAKARSLLNG